MILIDKKLLVETLKDRYAIATEDNETVADVVSDILSIISLFPEVDTMDVCLATVQGMMGAIKGLTRGDLDG